MLIVRNDVARVESDLVAGLVACPAGAGDWREGTPPPALSGPDVTVSRHPAPTVRPAVDRLSRLSPFSTSIRVSETPSDLGFLGADDGIRTRDPNLGKVVLYQLSHVRSGS